MKKSVFLGLLVLSVLLFQYCSSDDTPALFCHLPAGFSEDSLDFEEGKNRQQKIVFRITPDVETALVRTSGEADDAADDMALWINPLDAGQSVLLGTNKKGGIGFYQLDGNEIGFIPSGRINNIDVTHRLKLGDRLLDMVGCTNRSTQSVDLYAVSDSTRFSLELLGSWKVDTQQIRDVYGFCFAITGSSSFFVCGKNGFLASVSFYMNAGGTLEFQLKDSWQFGSQTEGLVVDPIANVLYVSEEDVGIWRIPLSDSSNMSPQRVEMSGPENPNIVADLEGLACYNSSTEHFLLASVQGNFSYAVFEGLPPNTYIGNFRIDDGNKIDGIEETDGIDAVSVPLGYHYPEGLFFAQDGFNFDNCEYRKQNFKMVDFRKIKQVIEEMGKRNIIN